MGGFKLNPNFKRELTRQVNAELQKLFDAVYNQQAGRPIGDVKAALQREAAQMRMTLDDDPILTELANAISAGIRLKVRSA